jgi:hypothetical protein
MMFGHHLLSGVRDNTDSSSADYGRGNFYRLEFPSDAAAPQLLSGRSRSLRRLSRVSGGWFTTIGDSTVRLVTKYSAAQIDGLAKFMIAHGIKGLSYYMLFGGTNFDYWAGRGKTTSYDYTAPIAEPGGLWSKYYAVKLLGDFLKYSQPYLSRCHAVEGGAVCADKDIVSILRSDGKAGFLFVVNRQDSRRHRKSRSQYLARVRSEFLSPSTRLGRWPS